MGKKIRGAKLKANDINKNTGKDISHTISKIKSNEKKYTAILVIIFIFMFCGIGYIILSENTKTLYHLSDDVKNTKLSSTTQMIVLTDDDILSDEAGLKKAAVSVDINNDTLQDINYRIIFREDNDIKDKCGCGDGLFYKNDLRYSLDGKTVKKILNDELIITTGVLKSLESDTIQVRIWLDNNSKSKGHFHGYLIFEKIEDL